MCVCVCVCVCKKAAQWRREFFLFFLDFVTDLFPLKKIRSFLSFSFLVHENKKTLKSESVLCVREKSKKSSHPSLAPEKRKTENGGEKIERVFSHHDHRFHRRIYYINGLFFLSSVFFVCATKKKQRLFVKTLVS